MKLGVAFMIAALGVGAVSAQDSAYLGVATAPLDPMTGRHLGLGEGVGLAVMHLDDKGVLLDKMEEGDILHKFNDQLLVSPEQLAILVRREKPGAKAGLTVIRSGKAETIEVKLGAIDRSLLPPIGPAPDAMPRMEWRNRMPDMRDWMENFQRQMHRWHPDAVDADEDADIPAPPAVDVKRSSTIAETRDGTTITLTDRDGDRRAKIEREGEVVFDGPINTERDLKKLPADDRARVNEMSKGFEESRPKEPPVPARRGPKQIL